MSTGTDISRIIPWIIANGIRLLRLRHKIIAATVGQYGRKTHIHRVYSGKRYSRYASTAPRNEGAEHQCRQLPDYVGKQGRGGQHSGSLSPRQSMA